MSSPDERESILFVGKGKAAVPKTLTEKYILWRVCERWQNKFPKGTVDLLSLPEDKLAEYIAYERIRLEQEAMQ